MPTTSPPRIRAASPHVRMDRKKLRRLRQLSGMSQVELGRAAELSNSYIACLERGTREWVSPGAFGRICDALSVPDRTELIADEDAASNVATGASEAQSGAMRAGQGAR